MGPVGGSEEHGEEFLGYIKGGKFTEYLKIIIFSKRTIHAAG
jgi:hypothetical protein